MSGPLGATLVLAALLSLAATPAGDRAPGRAIEQALAELGGPERVAARASWLLEGRGRENLSGEFQGLAPDRPTWRDHEERIAVGESLAVAWERRTPRNDGSLRWRTFFWSPDSSGFYDSNAGFGRMRPAPAAAAARRVARRVPHLLLLEAAGGRATPRGEVRIGRDRCDEIEVETADGFRVSLAIARDPAVLRRARYTIDFPGSGPTAVDWEWSAWRSDPRLGRVPGGHRMSVRGTTYQEVRYTAFAADTAAASALLARPADRPRAHAMGMPAADPADSLPETGEVAPGVHVVRTGGFAVMFVELRDFVVAMEAPENQPNLEGLPAIRDTTSVTRRFRDAIRAAVPDKPIRYAILSHHHTDHIGGARVFAEEGATLLVAPGHRNAVRAACGDVPARIETVARRRVIGDGARTLEIFNVGANPHTGENLFAWLPAERIVFQGDLFYFQRGGEFPPPGRETMNRFFARWLSEHGLNPRAVYGVHNDGPAGERHLAAMRLSGVGKD